MNLLKKALIVNLILFLGLILAGCGTSDIVNNKVPIKQYPLVKTSLGHQDVFTLIPMPITISNGKSTTTTITMVPMYQQIDHLKVWYKDEGKTKVLKTGDFEFKKTKDKEHIAIKKNDIGKQGVDCVIYLRRHA